MSGGPSRSDDSGGSGGPAPGEVVVLVHGMGRSGDSMKPLGASLVMAGYEAGIRTFDTSLGGLGGCPYAPGASGNVATEDVVDLFGREGITTGVDLEKLVATSAWLEEDILCRRLPSRVLRARLGARDRAPA